MKKSKIIFMSVICLALITGMITGCGNNNADSGSKDGINDSTAKNGAAENNGKENNEAENNNANDGDKLYNIGVIQYIDHEALNSTFEGFKAALADNGYEEGKQVNYDWQIAHGDTSNLSTISDRFVNNKVDMVLAIATDSAQSMAAKTTTIPIVGTAITSYITAGLVDSDETPGGNVTGTSDMNPVAAQIDFIVDFVPDVKTIGFIYTSSEDNSILQINIAKQRVEEIGLQYTEVTITDVNSIATAMQSLVGKCDAIYIPTDNTLASAMPTVHSVAMESKTPVICGESNMVLQGGLATMGLNYYDLGYKTGLMAIEIINGADPAAMSIQYADMSDEITINGLVAEEIGFAVPDKYLDRVINP